MALQNCASPSKQNGLSRNLASKGSQSNLHPAGSKSHSSGETSKTSLGSTMDGSKTSSPTVNTSQSWTDSKSDAPENDNRPRLTLTKLAAVSCIAAGVQFGWSIQLSLLTPYVQTLGIPHHWASFIWLCGPISGLVVQPVVGVWSDKCTHWLGRRRPYLISGSALIIVSVLLISFASEIGHLMGDNIKPGHEFRPFACFVFILGFWFLDLSNNTVQGPSRALLADLTNKEQCNAANSFYSFWIAVGSVLGYSAGSVGSWYKWFPFLSSDACTEPCANLKAAFLLHVGFLSLCASVTCANAQEVPLQEHQRVSDGAAGVELQPLKQEVERGDESSSLDGRPGFAWKSRTGSSEGRSGAPEIVPAENNRHVESLADRQKNMSWNDLWEFLNKKFSAAEGGEGEKSHLTENSSSSEMPSLGACKQDAEKSEAGFVHTYLQMPSLMHILMGITALSWLSWFPFLLFDTDWMGREIFHGDPSSPDAVLSGAYQEGVREGALGLMLFSIVQGITSTMLDPLCRRCGPGNVWGSANVLSAVAMLAICLLSLEAAYSSGGWLQVPALIIFACLGASFATTMVVPFTLAAQCSAEAGVGVGLAMGMLNMAIVVPQIIVSLVSGPLDNALGGGNVPSFVAACMFAVCAAVGAFGFLPANLSMSKSLDPLDVPHV